MAWSEFFSFRRMITPVIIQILFWVGVAASILVGLVALAGDAPVEGLLFIVLGPLFVRIYCELLIVIFKIHDSLRAVERTRHPLRQRQIRLHRLPWPSRGADGRLRRP